MVTGYTCGVFDIVHPGHVNILRAAKCLCDTLVVGLTTDEGVAYKGTSAVMTYAERKAVLESIRYVDAVVEQRCHDKFEAWLKLKFDVLFVGDDWYGSGTWQEYEERLNAVGVKVVYIPYSSNVSTTRLKKRLFDPMSALFVFAGNVSGDGVRAVTFLQSIGAKVLVTTESNISVKQCHDETGVPPYSMVIFGKLPPHERNEQVYYTSGADASEFVLEHLFNVLFWKPRT